MLRKTMIVLATAAALTGGLTADAFARGGGGGGGHMGGGGGGGHMGGGFGGGHMGGHFGGGSLAGRQFAGTRGSFGHERRFRFGFGPGDYGFYDYRCNYGYPNYNPYSCDLPAY
ncbi:MAG TPA: hypothetical protein VNO18_04865 [Xanthobacteraceae bacterium]|nr:hypothetical protein [Xanthobacteraceae bacterium]